ncbi:hypothetical protein [Pseudonocardia hydrocarbonoxydans]|uniref:hypothetical protein n=1 Tax=Pseudonocardia hydrocarbonoxydans TaxID=76726 RepID=UPI0031DEE754
MSARRRGRPRSGSPRRERRVPPHRPPVRRGTRWLVLAQALAAAAIEFVVSWTFDDGARRDVDALHSDSVWIEPGSPAVLDAGRARQVIGDRPIVAAVLPPSEDTFDRCEDVVARHDDVVAFVWTAPDRSAICVGDGFPDPDLGEQADRRTAVDWLERVILDARFSSRYRVDEALPDRTAQLEELVLAFDAAVPDAYADGVDRRELSASPQVGLEIAVRLLATVAAVVVGFVVLRLAVLRVAAGRARRRSLRTRRLEQLARTARLADAVLAEQPDDPGRARARADAAGRYVLVLAGVEAARDEPALDAADAELTALERTLRVGR